MLQLSQCTLKTVQDLSGAGITAMMIGQVQHISVDIESFRRRSAMLFWIFMLLIDLLIPFTMIGFGRCFMKKAPNEINAVFGYRTSMSMKNKDTWEFAHKYCGKIWYICGVIILPITVVGMLLLLGKDKDAVGTGGAIIAGIQLVPLIGSIFPTEIALRKNFDKNGKRQEKLKKSCAG